MTTEQKTFIENIAAAARKHAANYGIAVISPIIAQALKRRIAELTEQGIDKETAKVMAECGL